MAAEDLEQFGPSGLVALADVALDLALPEKGSGGLNFEVLVRARTVDLD